MIKIFSVHAKRTDFLKPHVDHLRLFCEDEFEYYCIDNFCDPLKSEQIKRECSELGVNYVRFSNYKITGTAWDHSPTLNSIKTITSDSDFNVILEFDVFLINKFSFVNYLEDYNISGIYQQRDNFNIEYIAPFVIIVNKDSDFSSLDFGTTLGDSCDVGGNTRFYLKNKNVKWMSHTSALIHQRDVQSFNIDYDPSFGCQLIENSFLHYYRGTNWDQRSSDYESVKTEWLNKALLESKIADIINHKYISKYNKIMSHSLRYWNGTNDLFNSKLNPYLNEN